MEMDCIPAGMELFPAADEEQWEFIRRVIDDCDYYLLIIGGRYGSTTEEGISYTEKEFDYAVSNGLKVVALVHGAPDDIPFGKSEQDPLLREKLENFKNKVMSGRLVKFWKAAEELPGLVALSLTKTIKAYPAIGWVRANNVSNESTLSELNEVRKRNAELENLVRELSDRFDSKIPDIAELDDNVTLHGTYEWSHGTGYAYRKSNFECTLTWRELFALIAPYLVEHPNDTSVKLQLSRSLLDRAADHHSQSRSPRIDDQEFKTVTIQLRAYGLVNTRYTKTVQGGMGLFWSLTERGERLMIESRVVRAGGA